MLTSVINSRIGQEVWILDDSICFPSESQKKIDSKRNIEGCADSVISPFDSLMNKREESN
jgi:hypothetical protein